jgi:1,4-dihydroxy-2-naphthoyl-CoA hydrolase
MIWKVKPDIIDLNNLNRNTLVSHLGIEITEIGDDYISSKMPVNHHTRQPMGLLHGGASAVLSESVGSLAGWMVCGDIHKSVVGIEINANHLKSVKEGFVYGTTRPVKLGRTIQVWSTEIYNDNKEHICTSRLTVLIKNKSLDSNN